jgi:hypothetical protein
MTKQWAYIIALSVVTIVIISGWEIFKTFTGEKGVEQYETYSKSISREFDEEFLENLERLQGKILVQETEITPEGLGEGE